MMSASATRRADVDRERRERTADKLVNSAARLVASVGTEKVTIDDFIAAAGVARGTFYNHFKTREALLDEVWTRVGHEPFAQIERSCSSIENPVLRFLAFTRGVFERTASDCTWGWLVFASSGDPKTVHADLLPYPSTYLQAGKLSGEFAYEDLDSVRDIVVASVRAAMKRILAETASEAYLDGILTALLRAVGVDAADASIHVRKAGGIGSAIFEGIAQ